MNLESNDKVESTFPNLDAVALAIEAYDNLWTNNETLFDSCETDEEVYAIIKERDRLLQVIRDAFFEATKDRNSRSACNALQVDNWLRALVQKWKSHAENSNLP